eukprot:TRINITY_DN1792_c0_g5_i1.p1 TRINITY_DN1792_c0_g5~~TRINITY_DN1792_c0_g5_i1.p1  ORF type:complete len:1236 (+),score=325.15 TRINITY_DN1792_c0_g5_i1:306-3710(+)
MTQQDLRGLGDFLLEQVTPIVRDATFVQPEVEGIEGKAELQRPQDAASMLQAACTVIRCVLKDKSPVTPSFQHILVSLHDVLIDIANARHSTLADEISQACETWWLQGRPDKEQVAPVTLFFLLVRALDTNSRAIDITRLCAMREALTVIDFQHPSTNRLKNLLLKCYIHPNVLHNKAGIKFLVYLFQVYLPMVDALHQTMKAQMRTCTKHIVNIYGEIYFRAWRAAQGPFRLRIESSVQDLMDTGMKAANNKVVSLIQKVLTHFYEKKMSNGVDETLCRLYEPIIWRYLHAANAKVRRNAALFFFDAFPLMDSEAPQRIVDEAMQRQFSQIKELLKDPSDGVRCIAVLGTCTALASYWELIPTATTQYLLNYIISDLAHDKSSPSVRAAVFHGLEKLLAQYLSFEVLKVLLPSLQPLIHDSSDRVRQSFVQLLTGVKGLSDIKFYEIVPLPHLLHRLAVDSPTTTVKITALLASVYVPYHKPTVSLLRRCLLMLHENFKAAVVFYKQIHEHVPVFTVCKLAVALLLHLKQCLHSFSQKQEEKKNSKEKEEEKRKEKEKEKGTDVSKLEEVQGADDETQLTGEGLVALLEVTKYLFQRALPLCTKENADLRKKLLKFFTVETLIALSRDVPDRQVKGAMMPHILGIMSALPQHAISAKVLLTKLRMMSEDTPEIEYDSVLRCLFNWKFQVEVLRMIAEVFDTREDAMTASPSPPKKQKSKRGKKVQDESVPKSKPKPVVEHNRPFCLRLFNFILCDEELRHAAFQAAEAMIPVAKSLISYTELVQQRIVTEDEISGTPDNLLLSFLTTYCKLLIHQLGVCPEQDAQGVLSLLQWGLMVILPKASAQETSRTKGKPGSHKHREKRVHAMKAFVQCAGELVFVVGADVVSLGLAGEKIRNIVGDMIRHIVQRNHDLVPSLLSPISRIIYHWFHIGGDLTEVALKTLMDVVKDLPEDDLPTFSVNDILVLHAARNTLPIVSEPFLDLAMAQLDEVLPECLKAAVEEGAHDYSTEDTGRLCALMEDFDELLPQSSYIMQLTMKSELFFVSIAQQLKTRMQTDYAVVLWKSLNLISVMLCNASSCTQDVAAIQDCLLGVVSKHQATTGSISGITAALHDQANKLLQQSYEVGRKKSKKN